MTGVEVTSDISTKVFNGLFYNSRDGKNLGEELKDGVSIWGQLLKEATQAPFNYFLKNRSPQVIWTAAALGIVATDFVFNTAGATKPGEMYANGFLWWGSSLYMASLGSEIGDQPSQ